MLTENILHPLLQQMFKMASLCTHTSPEMFSIRSASVASSTTVCCTPDLTALRRCFSYFNVSETIQSGLSFFYCIFFHRSVSSVTLKLMQM